MASKEAKITKVSNGYIVEMGSQRLEPDTQVHPNLEEALRALMAYFGPGEYISVHQQPGMGENHE
jgi:hypothetical protein